MFTVLSGCLRDVDHNPIVDREKLVGEYSNYTDTLLVRSDRTYLKQMINGYEQGHWSVSDSNMKLKSENKIITYIKVYEVDGVYELIMKDRKRQDPDTYDLSKTMKRVFN